MNDKSEQQYRMVIHDLCTTIEIMVGVIKKKTVTDEEEKRLNYATKVMETCINFYPKNTEL